MGTEEALSITRDWITALRSGKYEQGIGSLIDYHHSDGYEYCCLGVLCEILGLNLKEVLEEGVEDLETTDVSRITGHPYATMIRQEQFPIQIPNIELAEKIGEENAFAYIDTIYLGTINDQGVDFNTIAWIIEHSIVPHLEAKLQSA